MAKASAANGVEDPIPHDTYGDALTGVKRKDDGLAFWPCHVDRLESRNIDPHGDSFKRTDKGDLGDDTVAEFCVWLTEILSAPKKHILRTEYHLHRVAIADLYVLVDLQLD